MSPTKKILLTGATGLIGKELCDALLTKGWSLNLLGRSSESNFRKKYLLPCEYFQWLDPIHTSPPEAALQVDAVIHLMGEPIADKRWTPAQKQLIRSSRVDSTLQLVQALQKHNPELKTFISSSAIGYYGETGELPRDETSLAANDFLGKICRDWEAASSEAPGRCVQIRIGVVLAQKGGALAKMLPAFKLNLGAVLGTGKQWMSWIHIDDLIQIFLVALENPALMGPINAVAPTPVTNADFTKALASSLNAKAFLKAPGIVLKLALGEMAGLLLTSQRVRPAVLERLGFKFQFPVLSQALDNLKNMKQS